MATLQQLKVTLDAPAKYEALVEAQLAAALRAAAAGGAAAQSSLLAALRRLHEHGLVSELQRDRLAYSLSEALLHASLGITQQVGWRTA